MSIDRPAAREQDVAAYVDNYWETHHRMPKRQEGADALGMGKDHYSSLLTRAVLGGSVTCQAVRNEILRRMEVRKNQRPPAAIYREPGCSPEMAQKIVTLLTQDPGCARVGLNQGGFGCKVAGV